MVLQQFRQCIEASLVNQHATRPFICSGSPLDCSIMMVGYNPSRAVNLDAFDTEIWSDETGFDRERFVEYYDRAGHENQSIAWNRNHLFQQNFIDEMHDYAILETYLYSAITPKKNMLKDEQKSTATFDALVQWVKPKIIITQNIDVAKYFERATDDILHRNEFNTVVYQGHPCIIIPISHLSKKWNFNELAILRQHIEALLSLIEVA